MRNRTLGKVALMAILVSLLAGCGGQDQLTHEELVSKAGGICAEPLAQAQMVMGRPGTSTEELTTWGKSAGEAAPGIQAMSEALGALDPGSDDKATYSDMVAEYQSLGDTLQNAGGAAASGDMDLLTMNATSSAQAAAQASKDAEELGIDQCVAPATSTG
jgi:hypothetical protein